MKYFACTGSCWKLDCECRLHDGESINPDNVPPLHEGCTCIIEEAVA